MKIISNPDNFKKKEELYIKVRDAEQRVLNDTDLAKLPYLASNDAIGKEWLSRAKRFEQFVAYINKKYKGKQLSIIDIGCGNGWMVNKLYQIGHRTVGVDLNMVELEQAERVFGTSEKLTWVYADIMNDTIDDRQYDLIVLSASCQYFPSLAELTQRLKKILAPEGEIHLLDSMFYDEEQVADAKDRSEHYYTQLGFPSMKDYYFHHDTKALKAYGYKRVAPSRFSFKKGGLQWWKYTH